MSKPNGAVVDALRYLDAHVGDFTRELSDLSRIPSVSANGFPPERQLDCLSYWPLSLEL